MQQTGEPARPVIVSFTAEHCSVSIDKYKRQHAVTTGVHEIGCPDIAISFRKENASFTTLDETCKDLNTHQEKKERKNQSHQIAVR